MSLPYNRNIPETQACNGIVSNHLEITNDHDYMFEKWNIVGLHSSTKISLNPTWMNEFSYCSKTTREIIL